MDIDIRRAMRDDCDALGLVSVLAARRSDLGGLPADELDFSWTPAMSACNWRGYFDTALPPGEFVTVAVVGQKVVGYIIAGRASVGAAQERQVSALYVLLAMQRKGVGRALLHHAATCLLAQGVHALRLSCLKGNPNRAFYQYLGGIEVPIVPFTMDHGTENGNENEDEIQFSWADLRLVCP